jgi:hypothetical protein
MFTQNIFQLMLQLVSEFFVVFFGKFRFFRQFHVKIGRGGGLGCSGVVSRLLNFWSLSPLLAS